jgi:signal transduction histidine kinase/ABC-type branched-subunit amino acid transport system ATPase component
VPLLETVGLAKHFGPLAVLRGVDLRVSAGEIVALVGENGSGKSTVVACIAGALDPEAGSMQLCGTPMPSNPNQVRESGVEIVWQDQGLCDDLDVVANVFLGRKRGRWLLAENRMRDEAALAMRRIGAKELPLDLPVRSLSRGQRQLVALGRALLTTPRLLVLDEPTASLGVAETRHVAALIREVRDAGTGVLLVTHDLDLVFTLADRIDVLRDGRIVADVSPLEVHREDVVALMSGIEFDSMARRQLKRLQSLVDQLSDVGPAASLPLIVSAMAAALDQEMLCVHLLESFDEGPALRRSAAVGLPSPVLEVIERLPIGPEGGSAGLAAATGRVVVVDDVLADPSWLLFRDAAVASGIRSAWAAPIVGSRGVLGTVSGFATSVGNPAPDRLELATLYLNYAASAIERERLLAEVSRRNRVLESIRGMLETLAGPERVEGGLGVALLALSRGLGADAVGVMVEDHGTIEYRATIDLLAGTNKDARPRLKAGASSVFSGTGDGAARLIANDLAAVPLRLPEMRAALVAHWRSGGPVTRDSMELLDDAGRSLALAMEREALETARREASALRRSQSIQRELLSRLSHELRTPLTAIHGYASTLNQPDLSWDAVSTQHFLRSIAAESARMERLVGDLLDSTAIESGILGLQRHWCDVSLVVEAARGCVAANESIRVRRESDLDPVWADHDRLEQVLVNLFENALSHGSSTRGVDVTLRRGDAPGILEIHVRDQGPGIPPALRHRIFEPRFRATTDVAGAGLGLSIARGIVEAHGGTLTEMPVSRGALFVVSLPSEPPADTPESPADASWNVVDQPEERHAD